MEQAELLAVEELLERTEQAELLERKEKRATHMELLGQAE